MVTLVPDKPLGSRKPQILVENKLDPGRYRIRLVVVDDGALESDPADLTIEVRGRTTDPVRPPVRPPLGGPVLRPDLILRPTPIVRPRGPVR